jgi:hypothetical protein
MLAVSFASFLFGQEKSVKKSIIISPKIILPIDEVAKDRYVRDISQNSPPLMKYFSEWIISLQTLIGKAKFEEMRRLFTNIVDPNQNVAINVVPGWDTVEHILEKSRPHINYYFPIYSAFCSARLFYEHKLPSYSHIRELATIENIILGTSQIQYDARLFEKIADILCPDLELLTWDEIVEIKENKYYSEFIKHLNTLETYEKTKPGGAYYAILNDLFDFIKTVSPSLPKSILKSIICNLPIPPVNPFSIADAIREIAKNIKLQEKYAYLLLVQEIRDKVKE